MRRTAVARAGIPGKYDDGGVTFGGVTVGLSFSQRRSNGRAAARPG